MRILICGSRTWRNPRPIEDMIASLPDGSVVIQGGARGADEMAKMAADLARRNGKPGMRTLTFHADWAGLGKRAGPLRNQQMLDEGRPDRVVAFRMPGYSPGTDDMLNRARKAGIPVTVVEP